MSSLAKVVIVGRMNVGKSTLFNRLSVDVKSITLDYAGVTRDFISDVVAWKGISFELIDSGGISFRKMTDPIAEQVRQLGISLLTQADLIIFVCDGAVGITPDDREIADLIRKLNKDVILTVNKIDNQQLQDQIAEFYALGFKQTIGISASHAKGIGELLDAIVDCVSSKTISHKESPILYKMVLLGKPNVGKSSLMNLLLERERSLVADQPGTTREAISESIQFYKETIQLTDTPGVRRRRSIKEPLEAMMVKTSFRAVEQADVVLLMVDGSQAQLSDQELKLAFYAFEQYKALILLINKADLMNDEKQQELERGFELYHHFLKKIPMLTISCQTGKNVGKILPLVKTVWGRYNQTLPQEEMNTVLKRALRKTPLYHKTFMLYLYRVQQIKKAPITLVLFVNEPAWFGESQIKFFENALRSHYDLKGVPIKFIVRKGQ